MGKTFVITVGLMAMVMVLVREIALLPDGKLHLHLLDVGQGDAVLLVAPSGAQILIDGGPDLSTLSHLDALMPFLDRTIDLLVITHPDADHISALPDVLRRYDVAQVLMTGAEHSSGRYDALRAEIADSSIPVIHPDPAIDIVIGSVVLDIVWPTPLYTGSSNDQSIVLRVLYKEHSILLTGDIEEDAENAILASGANIESDILKVAHHGSRTSSSTGFLLAVDPDLGLISAGRDNRFGHPHEDVSSRFIHFSIPIKTTAREGVISMKF